MERWQQCCLSRARRGGCTVLRGQPGLHAIRITHAPGGMSPCHETGPRTPARSRRSLPGRRRPGSSAEGAATAPLSAARTGPSAGVKPGAPGRGAAGAGLPCPPAAPGSANRRCRLPFRPFPHRSNGPATVTRPPGREEEREAKGRRGTIATRSRRPRGTDRRGSAAVRRIGPRACPGPPFSRAPHRRLLPCELRRELLRVRAALRGSGRGRRRGHGAGPAST